MTEHEELAQWLEREADDVDEDDYTVIYDSTRFRRAAALLREARPQPVPVTAELLCELFAFAIMCDSKLKGDGLWDEEHDMSDGLLDRARAEIERQQSVPAAPPSSPHTAPSPAAAPSAAGSTDEAPGSPPQPPLSDHLADALCYLRPFADYAHAVVSQLEALERIQHTGGEDVEHDSPELSDREIAERAAMLIVAQALAGRGKEGHS